MTRCYVNIICHKEAMISWLLLLIKSPHIYSHLMQCSVLVNSFWDISNVFNMPVWWTIWKIKKQIWRNPSFYCKVGWGQFCLSTILLSAIFLWMGKITMNSTSQICLFVKNFTRLPSVYNNMQFQADPKYYEQCVGGVRYKG